MKYSKNFIIRRSYLPINKKIKGNLNENLSKNNIKKLSYRTAEFGGFSKIYMIGNFYPHKCGIHGMKYMECSNENKYIRLLTNPLLVSNGSNYILFNDKEKIILKKNKLLTKIFKYFKNSNINNNEFDLDIINQLIDNEFLIPNNKKVKFEYLKIDKPTFTKYTDYRVVNREDGNNLYKKILKYYNNALKDINKIIYILQNVYTISNINEIYSCFFEKYHDRKIKIIDFMKNEEILNKINNIEFQINKKNNIYIELIDSILLNSNKSAIEFNINLDKFNLKEISFDIYVNLLIINGDYILCIDTNHYLQSINSSNFISDLFVNGLRLGYFFKDQIKNIFYEYDDKIKFLNIYNEDTILENLYIYYSVHKNFFEICDYKGKKTKIIKPTKLDIIYFPKVIKNIYKTSDYINLGLPSTLDTSIIENIIHYPRVTIGNVIFLKETWIFNNKYKKYELFKEKINCFFEEYKIPKIITVYEKDYIIKINVQDEEDIRYLFKMNKIKIIFKEDLQKFSVIKEGKYQYSNEAIISFTNEKNANINIKNVINNNLYCTFNEWIFFEIYISDYDLMYNEVMLMLYEFLYKLKLKYFYINYMDNSENTLRLRIYKCIDIFKIVNFIQKKLKLYFVIKPYIREVNKYGKSIYNDIEKHFVYESQSILDCLSEYNFNNKVEICINFIDTIIEKLNLNSEEILTFFRQYKYLDIEYDINIKKEIQIYLNKN
ncbi:lantibiotic dehydratase C-terminal domain-containing protein, partial [Sneathia vaginalis]|uniref:lantibiotic dehydratase C-terminal domain-containing protein n=3 Tax=Sneathia vaginalis TaxID=187101 RepID=UPI00372D258A